MPGSIDFGQLFEHSPNAYMVLDRELRFVAANRTYLEVTCTRLETLLGKRVFEVFAEERSLLQQLFQQAPGFVCFLRGKEHVFELANAAYQKLVGHRPVLGKTVREALPEAASQGFLELLDRVYQGGTPFVGRGVKVLLQQVPGAALEERYLDFVYQPITSADGGVTGIFVQGSDITAQRRAEEERSALLEAERAARARAEAAERQQRFLAEAIPQQVWTSEPDGRLDFVSDRVVDYFGTSREQILGDGWQHVIHPDDLPSAVAAWTRALQTGEEYEIQFRLRRHDGIYRWHLGRARPMRDHRGAILRWYGTNTDIDEGRRAQDELEERAKFEQQLIGIVSHDLRNPLSAIGVAASLLLRRGNLDDQQGRIVGRMVSLVERTGRMIRDFLDFTQARAAGFIPIQPAPADLREITREVVDEVHLSHPDREVVVEHRGETAGRWDPDRLAQVVGNLVANAFQHSQPPAAVRVSSKVEGHSAEIEVQNDGPAIPEGDLKKLFAPFQRGEGARVTSARSVGLGLYITSAIVAGHGGRIEVESSEARGTRFIVRLPREVPQRSPKPAGQA